MDTTTHVTELDALLEKAGKRGFMMHLFRTDQHGPAVLAGVYQHSGCADVFVLSSDTHAHAYRTATTAEVDVFTPTRVYWWYAASPIWTLRAMLTLLAPGQPDAPDTPVPVPPGFGIPGERMPVRVRRRGSAHLN